MLKFLLSLINPIEAIAKEIASVKKERIQAENETKRLELDEKLAILEARKESVLSAQSDPFERWVRIGIAFPFIVYIWKLVIWDKVLALGVTDPLSPDLWTILWIVLGGYFVDTGIKRVFRR